MYSPLNEQLMFQDMAERTAAMRRARVTDYTPAGSTGQGARDTRRWWQRAAHRAR